MFPSLIAKDVSDLSMGYAKFRADDALGFSSRRKFEDLAYLALGKFRIAVLFAKKMNSAPLSLPVVHVVLVHALKQMAWIKARRVIAAVKGLERIIEIAIGQFMRKAVSFVYLALIENEAIVVSILAERPNLAFIGLDFERSHQVFDSKFGLARPIVSGGHCGSFLTAVFNGPRALYRSGPFQF